MPARSVLLNVSIKARGWENAGLEGDVREKSGKEEGKHERHDSATDVAPIATSSNISTSYTVSSSSASTESMASTPDDRSCATCHRSSKPDGSRLSRCTACAAVFYCSKNCQRVDWPSHKRNCDHRCNPNRDFVRSNAMSYAPNSPMPFSAVGSEAPSPSTDAPVEVLFDEGVFARV